MGWDLNLMNNSFMNGLGADADICRKALTSWAVDGNVIFVTLSPYALYLGICSFFHGYVHGVALPRDATRRHTTS